MSTNCFLCTELIYVKILITCFIKTVSDSFFFYFLHRILHFYLSMRENSTDCMYDCYFFNPLNNNKDTTEFSVCFLSRCNKLFVCVCVFTRKRKKQTQITQCHF